MPFAPFSPAAKLSTVSSTLFIVSSITLILDLPRDLLLLGYSLKLDEEEDEGEDDDEEDEDLLSFLPTTFTFFFGGEIIESMEAARGLTEVLVFAILLPLAGYFFVLMKLL